MLSADYVLRCAPCHNIAQRVCVSLKVRKAVNNAFDRCKPTYPRHKDYHDRGIRVYEAWTANPVLFMDYLLTLPGWDQPDMLLDRKDNNKGYEPGNLAWVTATESNRNRRNTKRTQRSKMHGGSLQC